MSDIKINLELDSSKFSKQFESFGKTFENEFSACQKSITATEDEIKQLTEELSNYTKESENYKEIAKWIQDDNKKLEEQKKQFTSLQNSIGAYAQKIEEASKKQTALTNKLSKLDVNSDEYKKVVKEIKNCQEEQEKFRGKITKATKSLGEQVPVVKRVGKAITSAAGIFNQISWAIQQLQDLFEELYESCEPFAEIVDYISGAVAAWFAMVKKYIGALVKLFTGDFSGAINDFKEIVTGVVDTVVRVAKATALLKKQIRELDKALLDFSNQTSVLTTNIEAYKKIIEDSTTSVQQKKDALTALKNTYEQLNSVLKDQRKQQQDIIKSTINAKLATTKLNDVTAEQTQSFVDLMRTGQTLSESMKEAFGEDVYKQLSQSELKDINEQFNKIKETDKQIIDSNKQIRESEKSVQKAIKEAADNSYKLKDSYKESSEYLEAQKTKLEEAKKRVELYSEEWKQIDKQIKDIDNILKYGKNTIEFKVKLNMSDQEFTDFEKYVKDNLNNTLEGLNTEQIQEFYAQWLESLRIVNDTNNDLNESLITGTSLIQRESKGTEDIAQNKQQEQEAQQNLVSAYNDTASAIGDVTGETELAAQAQQAMNLALQIQAMAQAISTAAEGDPYTVALRIAAASAAVVAGMAKFTKFATGGIVEGQYQTGDMNLVAVNGGEMILNKNQQGNLFRLIQNGTIGGQGGDVQFRISGKDLVGTLNNYNKYNSLTK